MQDITSYNIESRPNQLKMKEIKSKEKQALKNGKIILHVCVMTSQNNVS